MSISGDNILQRIIRLVLDHTSAKKFQDEMDEHAKHTEHSWKETALHIAEAFGLVFALEKMREFGKEAIKEASESQAAWEDLQVSIENTGTDFQDLKGDIKEMADALRDATGQDDDKFVQSLARLVTLTGDTTASMNNMALVANVAAKFFRGDLEPATQLVAKAMNGNVLALHKLGIAAKDGQEALDILAQRSMGAAEARMHTFAGQTESLNTAWKDMLKAFGFAIIESGGAASSLDVMSTVVRQLTEWIEKNKAEISSWVTNGVAFAIDATDTLIRATQLLYYTMVGTLQLAFGITARSIAAVVLGYVDAKEAAIGFLNVIGINKLDELAETERLRKRAEAMRDWGKAAIEAGNDASAAAKKALTTPLFSSDQFKGPAKTPSVPGEDKKPMMGKNASTDATKEVAKAIEEFSKAEKSADNMRRILGDDFDSVGKEIERSTKLLDVLAANGIDPSTVGFGNLAIKLRALKGEVQPINEATKEFAKTMREDAATAAITMATGTDQATTKLDLLKKEQSAALAAMTKLGDKLKDTEAYKNFAQIYQNLAVQIGDETKIQAAVEANKRLAETLRTDLATGALSGASALDQLKKQQDAALQSIVNLRKAGDETSVELQAFQKQYQDLSDAVRQAADIQGTADAFRDLGDAIRSSVFEESVHAITKIEMLTKQQKALEKAMNNTSVKKNATELAELRARYQEVTDAIKEQTVAMQLQTTIADFLAEALGAAMVGGLGKAAAQKAKQLGLEAAEMAVRAVVFAAFGNFPAAAAAGEAALTYGGLALAWAALSAAAGGSGGGASVTPASSGASASNSGQDLTQARSSSSSAASSSTTPSPEVSIYMVGPGFDALNPRVQEVVWGARQEAAERFGPNARIRIRSSGSE